MTIRLGASGVAIALAMAVGALGCSSSSKSTGGTGGGPATGGRGGTGGNSSGGAPGSGGSGTGGVTGSGGGVVGGRSGGGAGAGGTSNPGSGGVAGGPSVGGANAGGTIGAGGAPTCGPFANGGAGGFGGGAGGAPSATMSFFVTSQTNMSGDLGGLAGADQRCQTLAMAVGLGAKTWHAYLSVEHAPATTGAAVNARDRIGAGPWFNAKGVMVAADLAGLHARMGDAAVFIDEHGNMINGQWTGSPSPTQHDVLTGSNADGTLAAGKTCLDWTSAVGPADPAAPAPGTTARVGHTDGYGPMCSTATTPNNVTSWNSAHDNAGCNDTAPRGGSGRIYCFAL